MHTREFDELKSIVDRIEGKVDTMVISLKNCQARCHVENPPKGWRRFFKSIPSFLFLLFI
jgi:hypothetical protein